MTFKEFKRRAIAILEDDRSYFLEGEELEAWKEKQKEISERQAELKRKEEERLKHCNLSTIPKKSAQNRAP